jgi:hypothetical protein
VFHGPVQVRAGRGAVTLLLRGCEAPATDRRREFTELAFAAAQAAPLPAVLHEVRVFASDRGHYRIEALRAAGMNAQIPYSTVVLARSVQLHRESGQALFGAVPPPRLPRSRRLLWLALLNVLRLPGATQLVERMRGEA